jgi:hypothetical protein
MTEGTIAVPETPPFGSVVVAIGKKGAGKTLLALNSPWTPVHVIDTERSSEDYFKQADRLIQMGVLAGPFTRADCPTYELFDAEIRRILSSKDIYGTLAIDTGGQLSSWMAEKVFTENAKIADSMSQVVWGKVRDRLRGLVLKLATRAKLVIMTAHERKYGSDISPRMNPSIMEVAGLSVRLVRLPNAKLPGGIIMGSRLPFFPPKIKDFTIASLLQYFENPADWDNLKDDEKVEEEVPLPLVDPDEA